MDGQPLAVDMRLQRVVDGVVAVRRTMPHEHELLARPYMEIHEQRREHARIVLRAREHRRREAQIREAVAVRLVGRADFRLVLLARCQMRGQDESARIGIPHEALEDVRERGNLAPLLRADLFAQECRGIRLQHVVVLELRAQVECDAVDGPCALRGVSDAEAREHDGLPHQPCSFFTTSAMRWQMVSSCA